MKRTQARIHTVDGHVTVTAYELPESDFIVHRAHKGLPGEWSITHRPTGLRMPRAYTSRKEAERVARAFTATGGKLNPGDKLTAKWGPVFRWTAQAAAIAHAREQGTGAGNPGAMPSFAKGKPSAEFFALVGHDADGNPLSPDPSEHARAARIQTGITHARAVEIYCEAIEGARAKLTETPLPPPACVALAVGGILSRTTGKRRKTAPSFEASPLGSILFRLIQWHSGATGSNLATVHSLQFECSRFVNICSDLTEPGFQTGAEVYDKLENLALALSGGKSEAAARWSRALGL